MIVDGVGIAGEHASQAALVFVTGRPELAERLRDAMEARGQHAVLIDDALIGDDALTAVVRALDMAGVTAITARKLPADALAGIARSVREFAEGDVVVGDGLEDDEILRLAGVRI
jgi:signal recognition particle GTPase